VTVRRQIPLLPHDQPVSLPLRGRPVTIGDRTRELVGRCDNLKKTFQTQFQSYMYEQSQRQSEAYLKMPRKSVD
jgi:hypothetical protein